MTPVPLRLHVGYLAIAGWAFVIFAWESSYVIEAAAACGSCCCTRSLSTSGFLHFASTTTNQQHPTLSVGVGYGFGFVTRDASPFAKNPAHVAVCYILSRRVSRGIGIWLQETLDKVDPDEVDDGRSGAKSCGEEKDHGQVDPVSSSMVGAIGFYKKYISPLLPPACRFFPTCSQYGVQAIQSYGPTKGSILTAWRLMRCTPFGGRGYDPPRWPPVAYNAGSY